MKTEKSDAPGKAKGLPENPLISVIVPVFDCERYIGEAIDSVLEQDYRPIEIVVVDNGCTDRTPEIVGGYGAPVRVCREAVRGAAASRARGVAEARGSLLAFLDADDVWTAGKLTVQVETLVADPALDMVFGHVQQFNSPDLDIRARHPISYASLPAPGWIVSTMLIKREALERVTFTNEWRTGDFIDWYIRATEAGLRSAMLPRLMLRRRLHDANMTLRDRESRADYARILKAALDPYNGPLTQ